MIEEYKHFYNMNEGTSDLIIAIAVAISSIIIKALTKKIKWGWKIVIGMLFAIMLSMIGHLIVKMLY